MHISLYEFGRLAEHVLLEALRICHFANGSEIRFTIFDSGENKDQAKLMQESSNLASICKIDYVELALNAQEFSTLSEPLLQSVTEHVVCCATDERSLEVALLLRKRAANAPILVRMQQSSGLAQLLESNLGLPEIPDGLYPFGMLDATLYTRTFSLTDLMSEPARYTTTTCGAARSKREPNAELTPPCASGRSKQKFRGPEPVAGSAICAGRRQPC